jgi:hypothetical protein
MTVDSNVIGTRGRRAENPGVGGSIPSLPTILSTIWRTLFPRCHRIVTGSVTASVLWPVSVIAAGQAMSVEDVMALAREVVMTSRASSRAVGPGSR